VSNPSFSAVLFFAVAFALIDIVSGQKDTGGFLAFRGSNQHGVIPHRL
jgi:hypothetical protein